MIGKRGLMVCALALYACGHRAPPPGKPDTTPPTVNLIHPPEGFSISQGDTVGVVFEAVDSSEVVRAVMKVNDQVVAADSAPPLELLWVVDTARFHPSSETLRLTLEVWDYWDNTGKVFRTLILEGFVPPSSDSVESEQEKR